MIPSWSYFFDLQVDNIAWEALADFVVFVEPIFEKMDFLVAQDFVTE